MTVRHDESKGGHPMRRGRQMRGLLWGLSLHAVMAGAAEPPPTAPVEGYLSVLAIDAEGWDGKLKHLQRLTVAPFVVPDPLSKTRWTVNLPDEGDDDQQQMQHLLSQSISFGAKVVRDEAAPKFVELARVCGPEAKITLMTTPAPAALGYRGETAKHIQMIGLKGCTKEGVLYSKEVADGEKPSNSFKGVDCFINRSNKGTQVDDSCCFHYRDLNNFLDRCTADVRAYKQERGLLPKGFRYQPLTENSWTEAQYQYWLAGKKAADPVAHWREALSRWPRQGSDDYGFARYAEIELRRLGAAASE